MCKLAGKHVAYDGKVLGVIGYMFSSHDKGAHSRRNANRPNPKHRSPLRYTAIKTVIYNVICYFPFNTVALFKIGLLPVGTHENEASQTATQTLSNQINMTTFRLKFAILNYQEVYGRES